MSLDKDQRIKAADVKSYINDISNFRKPETSYTLDDVVGVAYHADLILRCIGEGITSENPLDTSGILEEGTTLTDGTVEWAVEKLGTGAVGGASDKIGSIISMLVSSTYTPDGCLPCDGIEYNKSAYNSFYTSYLVSGKLVTCTYEEYQQDITTYGQCAKFGLDTTNEKFKTPTIKDGSYLTQALSDTEIGKAYNESLPNIKGDMYANNNGLTVGGAFKFVKNKNSSNPQNGISNLTGQTGSIDFDASLSSSTYQDEAKVQGDNVRVRFFVVVSNTEELDVPEINQIEFNNPFFFGDYKWSEINIENSSWLRSDATYHSGSTYADFYNWILLNKNNQIDSGISVKTSTETYDDYDYVVNETDGTFRLPLNVKGASGKAVVGNGITVGLTNGTTEGNLTYSTQIGLGVANKLGEQVGTLTTEAVNVGDRKSIGITTDPTKSGIETSSTGLSLYFYVGETLQKTNVIDISKLQKEVDNLISSNREVIRGYLIPDYSAGIDVTSTLYNNKSYTAPSKGVLFNAMLPINNSPIKINGNTIGIRKYTTYGNWIPTPYRMDKGDVFSVDGWYDSNGGAYFFPLKDDKVKVMNKTQLQVVDTLPETPDEDTFYFIKGE